MHRGFSPFPELETVRLRLRKVSDMDIPNILFLRSDPGVNKYIRRQKLKNPEEVRDFISKINNDIRGGRCFYWAISFIDSPKLIGVVCLWNFTEDHLDAELGYELMPAFQNQGIMGEAVSSVLHFAFEQIALEKIEAFTDRKNKNSIRLLKNNGFRQLPKRTDPDNASNIIFSLGRNEFK